VADPMAALRKHDWPFRVEVVWKHNQDYFRREDHAHFFRIFLVEARRGSEGCS